MRLPEGCSVEWARQPDKQRRLLEWLENHPVERQCLFHQESFRDLNKTECAIRAAQAIFANDENPYNSHQVRIDPRPFAQSICNLIRLVWAVKYKKVNAVLGSTAARRAYSDFDHDSKKAADAEIKKFPQWVQLHGYWRESPQFNEFVGSEVPSKPIDMITSGKVDHQTANDRLIQSKSDAGRKRKRLRSAEPYESDGPSYVPSDTPESLPRPSRKSVKPSKFEGNRRRPTGPSSGPGYRAPAQRKNRGAIGHDDDQQRTTDNANIHTGPLAVSQYTPDQQFQIEWGRIQRDIKVEQNKALEIAQKREVFMMLFGPKNA